MGCEPDLDDISIRQNDPARPLYLQQEHIDRVINPQQFQTFIRQGAGFNCSPIRIGYQPSLIHLTDNTLAFQTFIKLTQINCDQIFRAGV